MLKEKIQKKGKGNTKLPLVEIKEKEQEKMI